MCKGVYNALRCNGVCIRNAIRLDLCNIGTKIEGELSQQDIIGDVLRNLVSFGQFKKRKKHTCKSVTFSKYSGFSLERY